jgi:hypothetical protein
MLPAHQVQISLQENSNSSYQLKNAGYLSKELFCINNISFYYCGQGHLDSDEFIKKLARLILNSKITALKQGEP